MSERLTPQIEIAPAELPETAAAGLPREDVTEALHYLDRAVAVFDRAATPLSAAEIRAKSMLTAVCRELRQHLATSDPRGRFDSGSIR